MANIDSKQIIANKELFGDTKNISLDQLPTEFIQAPLATFLDSKILQRQKISKPQTYRRPSYLQYIDYV